MARLISGLSAQRIRDERRARARADRRGARARAARAPVAVPAQVELLAAVKYVAVEDLPLLAEAGIALVGENRAQELPAKHAAHGELFEWDFIGQLQSRRVREIVPYARLIHSVASRVGAARAASATASRRGRGCAS